MTKINNWQDYQGSSLKPEILINFGMKKLIWFQIINLNLN